jgi:hypothetical protein
MPWHEASAQLGPVIVRAQARDAARAHISRDDAFLTLCSDCGLVCMQLRSSALQ